MNRLAAASIFLLTLSVLIGCDRPTGGDWDVDAAMRLYDQRKFAQAIPILEKSLDKSLSAYTRSEVLTTIGNCYNELDEFDKSLQYHDRAIAEDPNNHQAYVNKGVVFRLLGEYDKTEKLYAKALQLAPDYAELHASMGALAVFQGEFESAVEHLERAIKLDDSLAVAHSNLALAYAMLGRFADADQELKKAVARGYHRPQVIRERIDELRNAAADESQ